jgi:hypothetical protein
MIRQCFLARTGIQFHRESLIPIGLDPATLFPKVAPRPKQLKSTASDVAKLRASSTCKPLHHTHDDQVSGQASPEAACTFISEEHEELLDALSPINDNLGSWFSPWRILEFVPFLQSEQSRKDFSFSSDRWYDFSPPFPPSVTHVGVIFLIRPNWGYGRHIPEPVRDGKKNEKVLVHRSVRTRMEAKGLEGGEYKNKASFKDYEIEWVEWVE